MPSKVAATVMSLDGISTPPEEDMLVGQIIEYGGNDTPAGYLECDGAAVSRATYAALFAVYAETFGPGDGVTTFNVPDKRGRVGRGAGTGPGLSAVTVGAKVGDELRALTGAELPAHVHPLNVPPSHVHDQTFPINGGLVPASGGITSLIGSPDPATNDVNIPTGTLSTDANTGSAGSGSGFSLMNPYLGIRFLVFAGV